MNPNVQQPIRIVKKVKGHGGHHGGAWKVAYADFVTAMMALFIVLWILGQSDQMKQSISRYFQKPGVWKEGGYGILPGERTQPLEREVPIEALSSSAKAERYALIQKRKLEEQFLQQRAQNLRKKIATAPKLKDLANQIRIQMTGDGLRIDLPDKQNNEFFQVGSAAPKQATVELIGMIARELAALPNPLAIEGHSDSRPFSPGAAYGNWELSADRANAARRIMEKAGFPQDKIEAVRGYADRQLLIPDKPMDTRNRRVSFLMRYIIAVPEEKMEGENTAKPAQEGEAKPSPPAEQPEPSEAEKPES